MKKILVALMLCIVSIVCFGQKEFSSKTFVTETVDEFGDKTGRIKVGIIANGYFSNSATSNSCVNLIISFMKETSWASLYEYCGNHESDDIFNIIATGTTTNETIRLRSLRIEYSFVELCKNNDTIKIKMIEDSKYGHTTAVFKLFNCKEFYSKYVNEFGVPEYISSKVFGDYLHIYSMPYIDKYSSPLYTAFNLVFGRADQIIYPDGEFENGDYISVYCDGKIYINGVEIKDCGKYSFPTQPDFNMFMETIKPNDIISVVHKKTGEIEKFVLTQEQYDAIIDFYNN